MNRRACTLRIIKSTATIRESKPVSIRKDVNVTLPLPQIHECPRQIPLQCCAKISFLCGSPN